MTWSNWMWLVPLAIIGFAFEGAIVWLAFRFGGAGGRTRIPASGGHVSYSDPGDGYDSAIRWHADFERGNL